MSENVVEFSGITRLDIPAERVLTKALDAGLTDVVVVGLYDDGTEFFASSQADGGSVIWHLERAKLKLLRIADDGDE